MFYHICGKAHLKYKVLYYYNISKILYYNIIYMIRKYYSNKGYISCTIAYIAYSLLVILEYTELTC